MAFFGLVSYLVFVIIRPQEFMPELNSVPVVKFSLILAALCMLMNKERRFDVPQNKLLIVLLPLIPLSGLANGWLMGGVDKAEYYLTAILLPFLVIQNLVGSLNKHRVVMILLLAASMIMVSDGIAQKQSGVGVGWSGAELSQGTRITYLGIFNDPNDLGMFFVMLLPFAMYFYRHVQFLLKFVFLVVAGYLLYGIYLTNSRGALLGTISLLGLWFYLKYGFKKSVIVGGIFSPIAVVAMSAFREIDSEEASAAGRVDAWYEGFQMLFWKPFTGVGMGQFTEHHFLTAHNSFVLVFAEMGLVGYFIWIGFIVSTILTLMVLWCRSIKGSMVGRVSKDESEFAKTLTYSMLGYLVTSFFLSRAYTPLIYIFCAFAVATYYRASTGFELDELVTYKSFSMYIWWAFFGSLVGIYLVVKVLI